MAAPQRAVDKDAVGLWGRHERLAELTVRHASPAVYKFRRFVAAAGLMGYGSSEAEYYHLMGPTPEKFSGVTSRPICRSNSRPNSSSSSISRPPKHSVSQYPYRSLAGETIEKHVSPELAPL